MRILVMAPHADDEILGVGGTMAKFVDKGHSVFVCVVTKGDPSMYAEKLLHQIRRETEAAHRYLGVQTFFLDFPAVMLNKVPVPEINQAISKVITDIKPNVVFIPHFGDMHIDHGLVSQATMVAIRPINPHRIAEVYSYETLSETEWNIPHSSNVFIPNVFVDISNYLGSKVKAMDFFKSQLRAFPHPRSLETIKSLARLRGSTIGVRAAEAFSLVRKTVL